MLLKVCNLKKSMNKPTQRRYTFICRVTSGRNRISSEQWFQQLPLPAAETLSVDLFYW